MKQLRRRWSLVVGSFCTSAALGLPTAIVAQDLCASLLPMIEQAHEDFTQPNLLPPLPNAPDCATSLGLKGAVERYCAWAFPYRSAEAQGWFDHYDQAIRGCLNPSMAAKDDSGVNHPDSYDQRRYHVDGVTVSLALKDKANMLKTFVFLRIIRDVPRR